MPADLFGLREWRHHSIRCPRQFDEGVVQVCHPASAADAVSARGAEPLVQLQGLAAGVQVSCRAAVRCRQVRAWFQRLLSQQFE